VQCCCASNAVTKNSYCSHETCAANHHLHSSGERNRAQRKTKVSFGATNKQALYCCGWQKGALQDEMTSKRN